jgi:hypothetical protein
VFTRRIAVIVSAAGLAAALISVRRGIASETTDVFQVTHSDAEWRQLLTPDQYAVLRQSATERPFTSALLHEERRGSFACAGCDLDLFSSTTKFESEAGRAGRAFGRLWRTQPERREIHRSAWCERLSIAGVAAVISATSSGTVRNRRAFAIA